MEMKRKRCFSCRKSNKRLSYQDYIHRVPLILRDNLQRESHKTYDPPTSLMRVHLLRKQTHWPLHRSDCKKHNYLRACDFAHSPELWHQPRLDNVTCAWSRRLCEITSAIILDMLFMYRVKWWALVSMAMNIRVTYAAENFWIAERLH